MKHKIDYYMFVNGCNLSKKFKIYLSTITDKAALIREQPRLFKDYSAMESVNTAIDEKKLSKYK